MMTLKKIPPLVFLLALGLVAGIAVDELARARYSVAVPARPANIPASAKWSGGEDGGNWFDCSPRPDSRYFCLVFSDTTGKKISEGLYGATAEDSDGKLNPVLLLSDEDIEIRGARLVRVH